jgi:hypothetical protein
MATGLSFSPSATTTCRFARAPLAARNSNACVPGLISIDLPSSMLTRGWPSIATETSVSDVPSGAFTDSTIVGMSRPTPISQSLQPFCFASSLHVFTHARNCSRASSSLCCFRSTCPCS